MKRKSFTITGKDLLVEFRHTALHGSAEPDEMVVSGEDINVSDGFHTMKEVYKQRYAIFVALLHVLQRDHFSQWQSDRVASGKPMPIGSSMKVIEFATRDHGYKSVVWKSKHHSDCTAPAYLQGCMDGVPLERGTLVPGVCCSMFADSFVCGIGYKSGEQITYHLPLKMWDEVKVPELVKAPEWDGHTAADVLTRLKPL